MGLVRDLRGIAFAFNAKTSFMMLFDWMYPYGAPPAGSLLLPVCPLLPLTPPPDTPPTCPSCSEP